MIIDTVALVSEINPSGSCGGSLVSNYYAHCVTKQFTSNCNRDEEQGQGNQCQTPGVKFKEFTGTNRENKINLEDTGKKRGGKNRKL